MTTADAARGRERRLRLSVFAAGFATFAQVFSVQALLPAIAVDEGTSLSTASLALSATTVGMALAVLPWTIYADRHGRLAAVRLALAVATAAALLGPALPELWMVLGSRAVLGAALAAVPAAAVTYISEESAASRVTGSIGTFVVGNTLGGVCGRLVAGLVGDAAGWRVGLGAVGVLGLVAAALFFMAAPGVEGFVRRRIGVRGVAAAAATQLRRRGSLPALAQGFLAMGAFGAMYNYLGVRLVSPDMGVPRSVASFIFLAYLAGAVSARFSATLVRRYGARAVVMVGAAAMIAGTFLTCGPPGAAVGGLVVFTVGCYLVQPVATAIATMGAAPADRAQASGLYQLSWLTGTAAVGSVTGVLYERLGWSAVVGALIAAAALVAALAMAPTASR
ncbi:MFS transporter [Microbacterium sp. SORGH_AS_0888]|uniref:MFS transporter n=1 Tax=Microbacterium sp. SORGH_AS_0888 TaxID=3041791 RepID=UPI002781AF6F|nr:MFS transporter [Microbacterium sp. SORGH_AS_0888]MDQ1131277.1 YNFM family putative membrane transporter [Microbacterium sp. SORGH_AS_0888]